SMSRALRMTTQQTPGERRRLWSLYGSPSRTPPLGTTGAVVAMVSSMLTGGGLLSSMPMSTHDRKRKPMLKTEPVPVILVGAGHRALIYGGYAKLEPGRMRVVGVVDPDPVRRRIAS